MKFNKVFFLVLFSAVVAFGSLTGCEKQEFRQVGPDIVKGDQAFSLLKLNHESVWGTNLTAAWLIQSDVEKERPQRQCVQVVQRTRCEHAPAMKTRCHHQEMQRRPDPCPEEKEADNDRQDQEQWEERDCSPQPPELTGAHVVGSASASSVGAGNAATAGALSGFFQGTGLATAGALRRPDRTNVQANGGGGSAVGNGGAGGDGGSSTAIGTGTGSASAASR